MPSETSLHADLLRTATAVHRDNTLIWFVGSRALLVASGEWHRELEEAGWTPAYTDERGQVVHEANAGDSDFGQKWATLRYLLEWIP